MTKQVRIENADTSNYKVVVQTWDSYPPMPDGTQIPDRMVKEEVLEYPTAMTQPNGTYITSTRYLVIKEQP